MAARVISFRVDDEMINELEQRKLQDESIMLTAQRVLREALGLGVIGEQSRRVEEIVDSVVLPVQNQVEELRAQLEKFQRQIDNLNNAMVESLPNLNTDMWLVKQSLFDCAEPLVNRVQQLEERARLELFEESRNNSQLEERLNKLSEELPRLVQDIWTLKEATCGSGEPLLARVEKLEALISELRTDMEELRKVGVRSQDDSTIPADSPQLKIEDDDSTIPADAQKFECSLCHTIGLLGRNFKPSGSDKGKKRYMCLGCGRKPNKLIEVK